MVDMIKKSGVKEHSGDSRIAQDYYEALDEEVKRLMDRHMERAEGNNRSTVKARDV